MQKLLKILFIFLIANALYSQEEYHNWYFGYHSGITFNTIDEEPIFLEGNLSTGSENLSIISDSKGNLKYYSSHSCVYNKVEKYFFAKIQNYIPNKVYPRLIPSFEVLS